MSDTDLGAWAEMIVGADLLRLGFQPFRAVSAGAPCDYIVKTDEGVFCVEVRSVCVRTDKRSRYTPMTNWHTDEKADVGAYVFPDGQVAYCPPLPECDWQAVRVNKSVSNVTP